MVRHFLFTGVLCLLLLNVNARVLFVKHDGAGSGTSWSDALGNLAAALHKAQPGDSIWVAQGIYFPTDKKDRRIAFIVPQGVKVYGGFQGEETLLEQRNFKANKTVLSGNIGAGDRFTDNSYTVVYIRQADESTVLDGFIIADGTADGAGPPGSISRCGAGLYVDGFGCKKSTSPRIVNCVFQNNRARDGGAVYLNGSGGRCNPAFYNCEFQNNQADLDGGAVFNDGRDDGEASPQFVNCIFYKNQGNYGSAICNYGSRGNSSPLIQNCVFRNNKASRRGGAIFNMDVEGRVMPILNACQFIDNQAVADKDTFSRGNMPGEGKIIRAGNAGDLPPEQL